MAINRHRFKVEYSGPGQSSSRSYLFGIVPPQDGTATDDFDFGYDALASVYDDYIHMYIPSADNIYAIQGVPQPEHKELFPLKISSNNGGTFVLSMYQIENDFLNTSMVLYDAETDTIWDWNTDGPYTITVPAGYVSTTRLFLYARVLPTHKKMTMPLEVAKFIFTSAQPEEVEEFYNAVVTVDFLNKRTPKNKTIITDTYTLNLSDRNTTVIMNSVNSKILTIPDNTDIGFAIGTQINIVNAGTGDITLTPVNDSVGQSPSDLVISQLTTKTLTKVTSTQWVVSGGGSVESVTGNLVDNTDPANPTVNATNAVSADADNTIVLGSDDKLFVETPKEQDISGILTNKDAINLIIEEQATQNQAIALNTAKVTNATHTGDATGDTALTLQPTAISGKDSNAGLVGTEEVLINNAGTLEKTTTQDIADLGGSNLDFNSIAVYNSSMSGSIDLSLSTFNHYYGILTSNVYLDFINTPTSGKAGERLLFLKSTTTETLTFPIDWKVTGNYAADGTVNRLAVSISNFPTEGLLISVAINNLP